MTTKTSTNPPSSEEVLLSTDGPLAVIRLNRPEKLNAFAGTMRDVLAACLEWVAEHREVKVLLLTGAGRAFCAGGDVRALSAIRERKDEAAFRGLLEAGRRIIRLLRCLPQPSIALVNGVAAGAGFSLAMGCDMRIATEKARFIAGFGAIGLHPDWGLSHTLPRVIGPARALDVLLTARPISAEEALDIGLVNRIVSSEVLEHEGRLLATTLAHMAPEALARTRANVLQAVERSFEDAFDAEIEAQLACFRTEDLREGLAAFAEKRPARFQGT